MYIKTFLQTNINRAYLHTLTYLINVEDGINEEGRQIFFSLLTSKIRGAKKILLHEKVCGGNTKSEKNK